MYSGKFVSRPTTFFFWQQRPTTLILHLHFVCCWTYWRNGRHILSWRVRAARMRFCFIVLGVVRLYIQSLQFGCIIYICCRCRHEASIFLTTETSKTKSLSDLSAVGWGCGLDQLLLLSKVCTCIAFVDLRGKRHQIFDPTTLGTSLFSWSMTHAFTHSI